MAPVGEGAIRVTTGRSDIDGQGPGEAAARRAWAAPLSTRLPGRPSAADVLAWLNGEAARQVERSTLWTPITFDCGAALYFAILREPQPWIALVGVAVAAVLPTWSRSRSQGF